MRGSNRATVAGELLGHEGRDGLVTETDHVELTPDLEGAEVVVQVELVNGVGGVDDKVEGELVRLVPTLLLGADELLGTHLESILLLAGRVRDGVDLSTESLGPEEGEVTQTTDTDDTDLLTRASTEADQRRVDGQTSAEHGSGDRGLEVVGDLEDEVVVCTDVRGVTTLRDGAIRVRCTVCVDGVGAVVLLVSLAVVAGQVGTNLSTNTDWIVVNMVCLQIELWTERTSVADLAVRDLVADLDDLANDLVANAKRKGSVTPTSSDGVKIGSTDTTSLNGNVDIVLLELLELELALLEVRPVRRMSVLRCCD